MAFLSARWAFSSRLVHTLPDPIRRIRPFVHASMRCGAASGDLVRALFAPKSVCAQPNPTEWTDSSTYSEDDDGDDDDSDDDDSEDDDSEDDDSGTGDGSDLDADADDASASTSHKNGAASDEDIVAIFQQLLAM